MTISERIFGILESRHMSQKDFAELTGITASTISDWKRKNTNPSSDKIMTICRALEITPYELLEEKEKLWGCVSRDQGTDGYVLLEEKGKPCDYIIIDRSSDSYVLLEQYKQLDEKQRQRLRGYMDGLAGMDKR